MLDVVLDTSVSPRRLTIGLAGVDWDVFPASLIILLFCASSSSSFSSCSSFSSSRQRRTLIAWLQRRVMLSDFTLPRCHAATLPVTYYANTSQSHFIMRRNTNTNTKRHFWRARYRDRIPEWSGPSSVPAQTWMSPPPRTTAFGPQFSAHLFSRHPPKQRLSFIRHSPRSSSLWLFTSPFLVWPFLYANVPLHQ